MTTTRAGQPPQSRGRRRLKSKIAAGLHAQLRTLWQTIDETHLVSLTLGTYKNHQEAHQIHCCSSISAYTLRNLRSIRAAPA